MRGWKTDRGRDRDNETEMEKRWWKSERQRGGKKCQEALTKLNLSSKWLLNKRLRQQNEIIHIHSQSHTHTHTHRRTKLTHIIVACTWTNMQIHLRVIHVALTQTQMFITIMHGFNCYKQVECKQVHPCLSMAFTNLHLTHSYTHTHTLSYLWSNGVDMHCTHTCTYNPPNTHSASHTVIGLLKGCFTPHRISISR